MMEAAVTFKTFVNFFLMEAAVTFKTFVNFFLTIRHHGSE